MRRVFPVIAISLFILAACSDDSSDPVAPVPTGKDALIVVVENNEMFPATTAIVYNTNRDLVAPMFSEFFGVPVDSVRKRSFAQVLDDYGEQWTIDEVVNATGDAYEKIVTLTDRTATWERMLNEMSSLKNEGYDIDIILCLHASASHVCFDDANITPEQIKKDLTARGIVVRALFQTCCYSGHHLDAWEEAGTVAGCGSVSTNYMVLFSTAGFARSWAEGKTFYQSVADAYAYELQRCREVNQQYDLPDGFKLEPGEYQQQSSTMMFCGSNTSATIHD